MWRCTSRPSTSTLAEYGDYQGRLFEEMWSSLGAAAAVNPPCDFGDRSSRGTLRFGTNCDLSDKDKFGPQLSELRKIPAFVRVIAAGNMVGCQRRLSSREAKPLILL